MTRKLMEHTTFTTFKVRFCFCIKLNASRIGCSQAGAKIMGVSDAIEDKQQGIVIECVQKFAQMFFVTGRYPFAAECGCNALMHPAHLLIHVLLADISERNSGTSCQITHRVQTLIMALSLHKQVRECIRMLLQGFGDGMDADYPIRFSAHIGYRFSDLGLAWLRDFFLPPCFGFLAGFGLPG